VRFFSRLLFLKHVLGSRGAGVAASAADPDDAMRRGFDSRLIHWASIGWWSKTSVPVSPVSSEALEQKSHVRGRPCPGGRSANSFVSYLGRPPKVHALFFKNGFFKGFKKNSCVENSYLAFRSDFDSHSFSCWNQIWSVQILCLHQTYHQKGCWYSF